MKEMKIVETNESCQDIKKMEKIMHNFYFDGGYLYFVVLDKNLARAKSVLGKSIISINRALS